MNSHTYRAWLLLVTGRDCAMTDPMTPTEAGWLGPGVVGISTASFLARLATRYFPTGVQRRVS
jgi:hypothetical protein